MWSSKSNLSHPHSVVAPCFGWVLAGLSKSGCAHLPVIAIASGVRINKESHSQLASDYSQLSS